LGHVGFFYEGDIQKDRFSIRYNGLSAITQKIQTLTARDMQRTRSGIAWTSAYGQPFFSTILTAGIGIGNYAGNWAPYAPLGVGLQFNFRSAFYLFYRLIIALL